MLVCYLDDSGKDPQNPITTIAGFVADAEEWVKLEAAVEPIFTGYGVPVFHASDLHNTDGIFRDWKFIKKQSFVYKICLAMSPHVPLGVSMSALKATYKARASESSRKRTVTPYTFCFNVIIDWILRDIRVGRKANTEGLSVVLEAGHENNAEAEQCFYNVRKQHNLDDVLRSISFVCKENCRAIQMADLLAFYSRRHGAAMQRAPLEDREKVSSEMMNIIAGCVPVRAFVATDFENEATPL
jgi:hypothetical protein